MLTILLFINLVWNDFCNLATLSFYWSLLRLIDRYVSKTPEQSLLYLYPSALFWVKVKVVYLTRAILHIKKTSDLSFFSNLSWICSILIVIARILRITLLKAEKMRYFLFFARILMTWADLDLSLLLFSISMLIISLNKLKVYLASTDCLLTIAIPDLKRASYFLR
jgi:hypothetical protein